MASIKCAHCKGMHASVAEVRACANGQTPGTTLTAERATTPPPSTFHRTWFDVTGQPAQPASVAQLDYIRSLSSQRDVPVAGSSYEEARCVRTVECVLGGKDISKSEATDTITWLKTLPASNTAGAPNTNPAVGSSFPQVPAGHYAVRSATGNNDLDFFRVDRPTEGSWAGRTFVKRVIGGNPDAPVRGAQARAALEAILAAGVQEAGQLYGREIGRCCRCNRHLTDAESRAYGMGRDCRNK